MELEVEAVIGEPSRALEETGEGEPIAGGAAPERGGRRANAATEIWGFRGMGAAEPDLAVVLGPEPAQGPEPRRVVAAEPLASPRAEPLQRLEAPARLGVVEGVQDELGETIPEREREGHAGGG